MQSSVDNSAISRTMIRQEFSRIDLKRRNLMDIKSLFGCRFSTAFWLFRIPTFAWCYTINTNNTRIQKQPNTPAFTKLRLPSKLTKLRFERIFQKLLGGYFSKNLPPFDYITSAKPVQKHENKVIL